MKWVASVCNPSVRAGSIGVLLFDNVVLIFALIKYPPHDTPVETEIESAAYDTATAKSPYPA